MTNIILHIGGEKTGTTSLQAALTKNARLLFNRSGLLYPTDRPFFDHNGHFPLAGAFLDRSASEFLHSHLRRPPDALHRALDSLIARRHPKTVVFSAEHFSSRYRRPQLVKLAEFLSPHPVTVVFYVRAQDELALSAFGSGLMAGERRWFHPDAVKVDNRYFNHSLVADDWAAAFGAGNLRVRSYADLGEDSLPVDFLAQAGLTDPPRLESVPRLNQTISIFEARLLQAVNRHLPNWTEALAAGDEAKYRAAQRMRSHLLEVLREGTSAPESQSLHALMRPADRARIRERFAAANRSLAEKYGARIPESAPPAAGAETVDEFDIAPPAIIELVVALLRQNAIKDGAIDWLYQRTPEAWVKSVPRLMKAALNRVRR